MFSASAPSGSNLFSIIGIKVMTSGIAFDLPDRLSRLRAFPYDRFNASFAVVWVAFPYDRPDRLNIV